jgi:hypothetical protein
MGGGLTGSGNGSFRLMEDFVEHVYRSRCALIFLEAKGVVVQASAFFSFSTSMVSGDGNG